MRHFFTLCCLTLLPIFASAQVPMTIDIESENIICANTATTITIDFTVTDFMTITGAQFTIDWDETILTNAIVSFTNPNVNGFGGSSFPFHSPSTGEMTLVWGSINPSTLNDGDIFFSLTFNLVGTFGNALITIDGDITPIFVAQAPVTSILLIVNNGSANIQDNTPPNVTCPGNITQDNDAGLCTAAVTWTAPTPTDNCAITSTVSSHNPGDNFPAGNTTVTYTTTDAAGNTATCDFTITVNDTEAPTITCPANVVQNNDAGMCSATVTWPNPPASDNCGLMSMTTTHNTGDPFIVGITTVTYAVTDINGNTADCDFTVTVNDIENPMITCPANITQSNSVATWTVPTPIDNCAIASTVSTHNSGDTFPTGTTTVTYTTTDAAGNTATCDFDVTITNTATVDFAIETETLICPNPATTITIDFTVTNFVSITGMQFTIDWEETILTNAMVTNINAGVNNLSSANFTLFATTGEMTLVLPNSSPASTLPDGAVIFSLTFNPTGNFGNSPIAIDGGIIPVVINQGTPPNNIAHTVNNGAVNINDSTLPSITCPGNINQNNDAGLCTAAVTWTTPTPTDNCAVSSIISSHNSGDNFPVGNTTVAYTATDTNGNTSTCNFTITVTDTEAPTITCPVNVVQNNDAGLCTSVATWPNPPASDNCGLTSMTTTHNTGETFNVGTTTVTYTVTDIDGNTTACNFTVAVNDTESPTITCPANITQSSSVVTWTAPTPTDNCAIASTVSTHNSGDAFPNGTTTVTYTTTDNSGSTATCDFDVTVDATTTVIFNIETENIICADPASTVTIDVTVENFVNIGGTSFTINWDQNILGNPMVISVHNDINGELVTNLPTMGQTTFVWTDINNPVTLIDGTVIFSITFNPTGTLGTSPITIDGSLSPITIVSAGPPPTAVPYLINVGSVTFTDPIAPMITCPANITQPTPVVTWTVPTPTDNCAISSTVSTHNSGDSFPNGTTTVTYTTTDTAGNTATCDFDVTVAGTSTVIFNIETENIICADPASTVTIDVTVENFVNIGGTSFTINWDQNILGNPMIISVHNDINGELVTNLPTMGQTTFVWTDINNPVTLIDGTVIFSITFNPTGTLGTSPITIDGSLSPITIVSAGPPPSAAPYLINVGSVTFTDPIAPMITCPANITQANDVGMCAAAVTWTVTPTDNCGVSSTISTHNSGDNFPVGNTTVIYTVTDINGNTATCNFTITVNDTEAPNFNCPANITQNNDPGMCGAVVNWTQPTPTDNCAVSSTTVSLGSGSPLNTGITTVTYTATDIYGNTGACNFTITINDIEAPTITCPANISQSNDTGMCSAAVTWTIPTPTDNCMVSSTISTHNSGDVFNLGNTTVTYTTTDITGNTTNCDFTVTINDIEAPTITCPANISQSNDAGMCSAAVTWTIPTPTDNCMVSSTISTHNSGAIFNLGNTTVTYTVTDAAGNTANCDFTITVNDTENPVISCPVNISQSSPIVTWTVPTPTDNCAISSTVSTHNSGDSFPNGITTVTYTTTDTSGNTATCDFEVTIAGTSTVIFNIETENIICADPMSTVTIDVTIENFVNIGGTSFTINWDQNILGNPIVTNVHNDINGELITHFAGMGQTTFVWTDINNPVTLANGTVIFSLTFNPTGILGTAPITIDGSLTPITIVSAGPPPSAAPHLINFGSITFTDPIAPMITCPANITQANDVGMCTAAVTWTAPTPTDNCMITSTISNHNSGDTFNVGNTIVTYTTSDVAGNTATCDFTITVNDTESPTITCPANITQSNDAGICAAIVNWTAPTPTDNCAVSSTIGTHDSGNVFNVGNTIVTYTTSDVTGNTATCNFTIIVNDIESPSLTCPTDISQNNDPGMCAAIVNWTAPTATDNCMVTSTIGSHNSGDFFPVGNTIVIYTATDINGNQGTCNFTITVNDTESPTITCPTDIMQNTDIGMCSTTVNWTIPVGSDDCVIFSTIGTHNSGDVFNVGNSVVSYTTTDMGGNSTTCNFTITVTDNEVPTFANCPMNISQNVNAGMCSATATWTVPVATDNCGVTSTISTHNLGDTFDAGITTVIYTATDINGNTSTCSFDITIIENETPTLTNCPMDISQNTDISQCSATVTWTIPVATDNCGTPTISSSHNSGDAFDVGTTTVIYTATDAAGNTATCDFTVTINDTESPSLTCPANITQNTDIGMCSATVNWTIPTATDNCMVSSTISSHNSGDAFPFGNTMVNYTTTDVNGNTTTCNFEIKIIDTEIPVFTDCPIDINQDTDLGACSATVNWTVPVATDNCGVSSTISSHNSGDAFNTGMTTVIYTATDVNENTATCSFNITISDNEAPTITNCPIDINQDTDPGVCSATVNWTIPVITDNCGVSSTISSHNSGEVFNTGNTVVTYTATDINGNSTTCSFTISINENEAPQIADCPANISQMTDLNDCTAVVTWVEPTVTDNCGIQSFTSTHNPNDIFPATITTVVYTATDAAGNTSTCSFNITVFDKESPTVTCPSDLSIITDSGMVTALVTGIAPTVTDNCGTITTYDLSGATTGNGPDDASGTNFNIGSTTVTYNVLDPSGNSASCSFTINVSNGCVATEFDNCPMDIPQNVDAGTCQAIVTWPALTLSCQGYTITSSHNPGDSFPVGTTTVTYLAADSNGNTVTCNFNIIVSDNEAPQILTCPIDVMVSAMTGTCEANATWATPTFSDNCGIMNVVESHNSGDFFPVGVTPITVTAFDATSLSITCDFNVEVFDNEAPTLQNLQSDITINNDAGLCGANVAFLVPTATDNCGVQSLSCDAQPGDFFPVGQTTVNCFASDINGNTTLHTFIITVEDTENPTIDCPSNIEINVDGTVISDVDNFITNLTPVDCSNITIDFDPLTADDNCTVNSFLQFQGNTSGSSFPVGVTTMEYEATDMMGNSNICNFTITVQSIAPASISIDNPTPCEGEDIVLQGSGYPSNTFVWKDAGGNIVGMGEFLNLNDVTTSNSGVYTLETTISTVCVTSINSATITVLENPVLEASANDILCTDGSIDLDLTANILNGITISSWGWVGPDNFTSSIQNPTIPTAGTEKAGTYTVTAIATNGCQSTMDIEVSISEEPAIPTISVNDDSICVGDMIVLIGQNFNGNMVTYNWFANPTNGVIINSNTNASTTVQINETGDFSFSYTATVDGCSSDVAILSVNVQDAPNLNLEIDGDLTCLEGNTEIQINETLGEAVTYTWTTPNTSTFDTQNITLSSATSTDNGAYFLTAASSNGCETTESINVTITDAVTALPGFTLSTTELCEGGEITLSGNNFGPDVIYHWIGEGLPTATLDTFVTTNLDTAGSYAFQLFIEIDGCLSDTASAGVMVENAPILNPFIDGMTMCVDSFTNIVLMANSDSGVNYIWRNENGDTLSNLENLAIDSITAANSGNYEIIATSMIGCESSAILPVTISETLPPIAVQLQDVPCEDETLKLCTDQINDANYSWQDPNGNTFSNVVCPTIPFISSQNNGIYQVTAEINGCTSTAFFDVEVVAAPVAEDDKIPIIINTVMEFDVILNDIINAGQNVEVSILQNPIHGSVENLGNGIFRYTPKSENLEDDFFTYEICYTDCPNTCDIALVTLKHQFPDGDCTATTVITPNNDGINDNLTFFCLDSQNFPDNELIVFNIWGDKVFETTGYINNWEGTYKGANLPDGTYYYVFKREPNGIAEKGFVMIYR